MIEDFLDTTEEPHPITKEPNNDPYGFDVYTERKSHDGGVRRSVNPARVSANRSTKKESPSSLRKNGSRVSGFVQTIQELSPLVHLAHIQMESEFNIPEYEDNLTSLIKAQNSLLTDVCNRIGLNSDDVGDRFLVGQLSMRISRVILRLRGLPSTVIQDSINVALNELERWTNQKASSIREMINERSASSDILVNVKLGLFAPTIRLYGVFEKWGLGSWRDKHAGWLMDLAVDFARDLSFNWDKNTNFRDKQSLFQGVLENCADLVIDVYEDYLKKMIKKTVIADYSVEHNGLAKFYAAFDSMDMGYRSHSEYNEAWLFQKMGIKKEAMLIRYMPVNLEEIEIFFLEKLIVSKVDKMFADAWLKSSKSMLDMLEKMSDDEKSEYFSSEEGSKPMSLERFEVEHEKTRPLDIEIFTFGDINLQEVAQLARKLLAELWGISDAFCKISKNA